MTVLLDTNAYTDWAFHGRWHGQIGIASNILMTPTVIGELSQGFRGGSRAEENRALLSQFLNEAQTQIPSITRRTAELYGEVANELRRKGAQIPTNDIWIAAVTIEHSATLLTRDRHFERILQLSLMLADW